MHYPPQAFGADKKKHENRPKYLQIRPYRFDKPLIMIDYAFA